MKHIYSIILWICFCVTLKSQVIYNAYANISAITNGTLLTVNNVNQANHTFIVNDLVIVMQMQDDVIGTNTSNNASFGNLSSIQNAGKYEVARISAVNLSAGTPTSIAIANALSNTYNIGANKSVQLISFRKLGATFTTTNSITGLAWNGTIGGVIAIEATTSLTLAHSITANGIGFRGGSKNTPNGYSACDATTYATAIATRYAGKGEGIYKNTNSNYGGGRGKILNGGGGGNDVNAGGGGGGNYSAGGIGGLGWVPAGTGCSPTVGGLAGLALNSNITVSRIFMGGGGGGGHENDGLGTAGGNGGGIILLKTGTLITTGSCSGISISANGTTPANASNDGSGGGGAAGSIVLQVNSYSITGTCSLAITANGGSGGNSNTGSGVHGGGGGGGQGVIIYSSAQPTVNVTTNTIPGNGGTSCTSCAASANGVAGAGPNNAGVITNTIGPLPVELVSFTARKLENSVELRWQTASEKNTDVFIIEKSLDAVNWFTVTKLPAAGNSSIMNHYRTEDPELSSGLSYYRLKTIDKDLSFSYSQTEAIENRKEEEVIIFPNPSNDQFNIKFLSSSGAVSISIYDALGRCVYKNKLNQQASEYIYSIDAALAEGVYTLQIIHNNSVSNHQITRIK